MDNAVLVGIDIDLGAKVIAALDAAGVRISVALWMISPEYDDGRLVIASSRLDQRHPLRAYEKVAEVLHERFSSSPPAILILRMKDPFIVNLRSIFGQAAGVEGMRLGGQQIGNRFISNAYIYRIT